MILMTHSNAIIEERTDAVMKKRLMLALAMCLLAGTACAAQADTLIVLDQNGITINGEIISEDAASSVYLTRETQTHEGVPDELRDVVNQVINITDAGVYRISGEAQDMQIAVRAGKDDQVRLILDNAAISCRTAPAIIGESAYDPRTPGEYGLTIELAAGSENSVTGSHTVGVTDDDVEYDGAIGSQVSLGFEGTGSLIVDADNEGIEVSCGHMTINGGVFSISACDDPLNVSEDGVGTLTINDGYVYSAVKPIEGGEGDGIDSNGYIVFNGGTVINLAHPGSMDGGIDSDMGSSINGGVIVGAGNMYDPIDASSSQLFMMLEFGQETDSLVVVTDENDHPVFAYDFPHDYMYVAFSTPELKEGVYHVYLGGEIEGEQTNGLYTSITAYTPGERMQHGAGNARQRMSMRPMGGMPPEGNGMPGSMNGMMENVMAYEQALSAIDLNVLLKDADLNVLLDGVDLNKLLDGLSIKDLLTQEQIETYFSGVDIETAEEMSAFGRRFGGGMGGGPRGMRSSAEVATADFLLTRENTGFTNVTKAP